jgi:Caspase domain
LDLLISVRGDRHLLIKQAPIRLALVMANAAYPSASAPLPTTIADARAIADELRRSRFEVDLKLNLGKVEMRSAIDAFANRIQKGADVLFYFAGYGIEVSGRNYLIPINAEPWSEGDVMRDAMSVDDLLATMQSKGAGVKILILDAARSNPYERRFRRAAKGLAAVTVPANTLALLSAQPGQLVEESSVFSRELIKQIRKDRIPAEHAVNNVRAASAAEPTNPPQVPWVASSLTEEFSFVYGTERSGERMATEPPVHAPAPSAKPAEPAMPEFPWPPPAASASYVLPRGLFVTASTIGQVATRIISALEQRGYVERSFFRTEPGGVALVTRLERMSEDGSPAADNERWPDNLQSPTSLANFLRGIFDVDPGRYRVIVFVFQDQPFGQAEQKVTGDAARAWLRQGVNVLSSKEAQRSFVDGDCTALVYEFASTGKAVNRVTSRLTGKQHLEKAGVLTLLAQTR